MKIQHGGCQSTDKRKKYVSTHLRVEVSPTQNIVLNSDSLDKKIFGICWTPTPPPQSVLVIQGNQENNMLGGNRGSSTFTMKF